MFAREPPIGGKELYPAVKWVEDVGRREHNTEAQKKKFSIIIYKTKRHLGTFAKHERESFSFNFDQREAKREIARLKIAISMVQKNKSNQVFIDRFALRFPLPENNQPQNNIKDPLTDIHPSHFSQINALHSLLLYIHVYITVVSTNTRP